MPNQIPKTQSFYGQTPSDQTNIPSTDNTSSNIPLNSDQGSNPTQSSNINQYPPPVNMQTATVTPQGLIPDPTTAEFQHSHAFQLPPPPPNSFPRHISLPTYAHILPKLIRASSINNEEYMKNDDQNNKFLNLKVTMEFQGDINSMTMNWTPKEIENSRRLVAIGFKQHFNHLVLNFKPIDQSDYIPGTPVISCIYWNQTNKFYVTSVDLITLLEYLVNSKFPVEEKNRIRRNLQSLKPLTVSKSNPKFYRFFQLIMNFQNPKPRHIEKDVKVLSWSALRESLQKVLSKYTIDPTTDGSHIGGNAIPYYDSNTSRTNTSTTTSTLNSNNSANSSAVNPSSTSSSSSSSNPFKGNHSNQLYNSIPDASNFNYSLQPPIQESFYPYYQYPPGVIPHPQGQQQPPPQSNSTPQNQPPPINYQQPFYNQPAHQIQYQQPSMGSYQDSQYQSTPQVHGPQPVSSSGLNQNPPSSSGTVQTPTGQDIANQGAPNPLLQGNTYNNMYYYQ
ncbi:Transcription elongation factor [Wickerhamomyces ciferrii]|uniref:Transcription elongation factor n=1 Tax=Wickerhamomyces ciferrii (strain ATCC 14091 / BCRC 22168 / CBS 111 / JCM 3599 / NBRC 0793 / NRRL Y-1031 F-60-10) TaxID=1206466 RepID=K0KTJ4_WICCF|nr:Transcription elongation factor [Wickerhamomyces ciferrii]CCH45337.1 Transcription elongation factor [Wickerhamomyces ciferrii]